MNDETIVDRNIVDGNNYDDDYKSQEEFNIKDRNGDNLTRMNNTGLHSTEIWQRLDAEKSRQERRLEKLHLRSSSPSENGTNAHNDDGDSKIIVKKSPAGVTSFEDPTMSQDSETATVSSDPEQHQRQQPLVSPHRLKKRVSISSAYKITSYNKPHEISRKRINDMDTPTDLEHCGTQPDQNESAEQQEEGEEKQQHDDEPKRWLYTTALCVCLCSTFGLLAIVMFAFGAYYGDVTGYTRDEVEYLSPPGTLDVLSSPQRLALDWLVKVDSSGFDLEDDKRRREARYALAVLYYSTTVGSSRWDEALKFLTEDHECAWSNGDSLGVFCDDAKNIVTVSLPDNNLRGTLPMELSALSQLTHLDLQNNKLSGTIPNFAFDKIDYMNFNQNSLQGTIPSSLLSISSLRILDLSSNLLHSTLPGTIGQLANLESLSLGFNDLAGPFPLDTALTSLRTLNITSNTMIGTMDFVQFLPLAETLDFSFNEFTGRIPGIIGGLTNLQTLLISDNRLFGNIRTSIGNLEKLVRFSAGSNELNGEFPWESFSAGTNTNALVEIRVNDNRLTGTLPSSMDDFPSLEIIELSRNLLSGSIPDSLGTLEHLKELYLSQNSLTGTLPIALSKENLVMLDVHSNALSGTIPANFSVFESLEMMALHDNNLNGTVPEQLHELVSIERMSFHLNNLEGQIDFLCDIEPRPVITADCAGDPPQIECSCCYLCLE